MKLRKYQNDAVQQTLFEWLPNNDGGCLIVMPTGTGKSIVIADIIRVVTEYPGQRLIVATHSQELVEQDYLEFMELCPFANAGIFCAGLGQRNLTAPVLFVSIQSVYEKGLQLGRCDILMADEAHGISRKSESMWGQLISSLRLFNHTMRLIGLTATDFRLDSGRLIGGKGAMFHGISYEYPLLEAVQEGYLCELIPKRMETKYNISGVHKRGGEYIPGELEKAVNVDSITKSAIDETISYGVNRRSWLIFGSGIEHCNAICAELKSRNIKAEVLTKDTPKADRKKFIKQYKNYEIQCLVSLKILTTGFNHKGVDLIADMHPTGSAGLHVQKLGRGTRAIYADGYDLETREGRLLGIENSPKKNCLYLDFAKNGMRFGPLDQIKGNANKEKGSGDAPVKTCPKCFAVLFAGSMECPDCGYLFPEKPPEITKTSGNEAVLSTQIEQQKPLWHKVIATQYSRHKGKNGKADTFRAKYTTYTGDYNEFIGFESQGYAREKACQWHKKRLPNLTAPYTIEKALSMSYPQADEILVQLQGKYGTVVDIKFKPDGLAEILPPLPTENNFLAECEEISF